MSGGLEAVRQLCMAARSGDVHTVAGLLAASGAGLVKLVNTPWGGSNALIEAADNGQLHVVEALVRAGAELDFQDERGWTALMKGCKSGSAEVVLELLHAGADATRINSDGRTAMDWAEAYGRADIQELIGLAGQGALPVKARAACVDPQLTAEGNSSAPAAAHAHGSASCSGLDSEARRSPPPRTAGDVGVDERRPAAVDPAAGQRSLAHELRQLRQRVRGLEGGDSGSSDRSSPAAVPQLRDHHQLATVVDSSSVGSPADRLSGWRSAPRYVGELSTRLKHVEQQLSAQAQHWETELRGMAGQIEVSQQLELEMQRSARDGEAQRQGALLERLAKAEEVGCAAVAELSKLREEYDAVRAAVEEAELTQSIELGAARAAVEVERESRLCAGAEHSAALQRTEKELTRLRRMLAIAPPPPPLPSQSREADGGAGSATTVGLYTTHGREGLNAFLEAAELQHYADVLEEMLGAAVVEDLLEMEPEDMELLGLKKLERKRLARAVLRLRAEVEAQADAQQQQQQPQQQRRWQRRQHGQHVDGALGEEADTPRRRPRSPHATATPSMQAQLGPSGASIAQPDCHSSQLAAAAVVDATSLLAVRAARMKPIESPLDRTRIAGQVSRHVQSRVDDITHYLSSPGMGPDTMTDEHMLEGGVVGNGTEGDVTPEVGTGYTGEDWLGLDALSLVSHAAHVQLPRQQSPAPQALYESEDFEAFLAAARLSEFGEAFTEHGYDDLAVLRSLSDRELQALLQTVGMGPGHSARFLLGLRISREAPLGLWALGELRVSATVLRPHSAEDEMGSGPILDDDRSARAQVLTAEEPKVFRLACETCLADFQTKLAAVLRLPGGPSQIMEITYTDGVDEKVVIVDERDFTDAKAVAARDAGCRLECTVELQSSTGTDNQSQLESSQLEKLTQLLGSEVVTNLVGATDITLQLP